MNFRDVLPYAVLLLLANEFLVGLLVHLRQGSSASSTATQREADAHAFAPPNATAEAAARRAARKAALRGNDWGSRIERAQSDGQGAVEDVIFQPELTKEEIAKIRSSAAAAGRPREAQSKPEEPHNDALATAGKPEVAQPVVVPVSPEANADANAPAASTPKLTFDPPKINVTDADMLKYACLSYSMTATHQPTYREEAKHRIAYRGVYAPWKAGDPHELDSFHKASRKNPWLTTVFDPSLTADSVSKESPKSPSMFVPGMSDPSHCLHDLLFTLLPMASEGKLKEFDAIAVARPGQADDTSSGDYCTSILQGLGWFNTIKTVPNATCLDGLWVPAFMYHRTPRGNAQTGAQRSSGSEYVSKEDLPLKSIISFQQQMWRAFVANNEHLYKGKKRRIVFDTREASGKGAWTSARAVADSVREQLDPERYEVEVVENVGKLSIKEQAALFHSASILVAPYGGSISNVIFMKHRTRDLVRGGLVGAKLDHGVEDTTFDRAGGRAGVQGGGASDVLCEAPGVGGSHCGCVLGGTDKGGRFERHKG